jgi:hypothetical protein
MKPAPLLPFSNAFLHPIECVTVTQAECDRIATHRRTMSPLAEPSAMDAINPSYPPDSHIGESLEILIEPGRTPQELAA